MLLPSLLSFLIAPLPFLCSTPMAVEAQHMSVEAQHLRLFKAATATSARECIDKQSMYKAHMGLVDYADDYALSCVTMSNGGMSRKRPRDVIDVNRQSMLEDDCLVAQHVERMRAEMMEGKMRFARQVISLVDERVSKRVRAKDEEIEHEEAQFRAGGEDEDPGHREPGLAVPGPDQRGRRQRAPRQPAARPGAAAGAESTRRRRRVVLRRQLWGGVFDDEEDDDGRRRREEAVPELFRARAVRAAVAVPSFVFVRDVRSYDGCVSYM
ncbi:putative BOI-related E3 ubiquitin-protein ligase 3 [Iris pallida]|uniref:BOI-related E3 ubiquitin-protein ligase 3 n=1 Tax=Iris pallida TaxID=29817 RepID=A0AAX6H678_IRIPA|nr:putative BOI-related E3 ubiquitin-protein ligase 3 [Iris pallida]